MKPSITVIAATDGYRASESEQAIALTTERLPFGVFDRIHCKLITHRFHWGLPGYSRCVIRDLADTIHTDSDFALVVQWDGYLVNPQNWTDDFLNYDYIGAPWPLSMTSGARVGNGGFSLRSRKWLEAGKTAPPYRGEPEDVFCCQKYLSHWLAAGCKVAPLDLAIRFSMEHPISEYPQWTTAQSLGFHGWFNPDREQYRIKA
jgi:hypothetical protein